MTVKAVLLGLFLALVFGAANAYLGMKAGQTVAATIPAAVIAMALFRLPAFRGGILEQNIARTAGSVPNGPRSTSFPAERSGCSRRMRRISAPAIANS